MKQVIPIKTNKRVCGNCTACCEGWLEGVAHTKHFYPGRSCHFKGENCCTIYKDRPDEPCKSYKCVWLVDNNVPEWLRPDLSKVIITERDFNGIKFWDMIETGSKVDSSVLNWLFMHYGTGQVQNIMYRVDGGINYFGTPEFIKAYTGKDVILPVKE